MLKEFMTKYNISKNEMKVLILILMEHAQRDVSNHGLVIMHQVLILILMEHAQREHSTPAPSRACP